MTTDEIRYPWGPADVQTVDGATGTLTPAIKNSKTTLIYTAPAGAVTLNLALNENLQKGDTLFIDVDQPSTGRNFTLGTGFDADAPDLTGVANDRDVLEFEFDGTAFRAKGNWEKIVDAA